MRENRKQFVDRMGTSLYDNETFLCIMLVLKLNLTVTKNKTLEFGILMHLPRLHIFHFSMITYE